MTEGTEDFFDWAWIDAMAAATETDHLRHVRLADPLTVKIDGRTSRGVILPPFSPQEAGFTASQTP